MSPTRTATAARAPFVVLIVALLAGGLITLLLLNAAVNQDSFELNRLEKETTKYTDEQQALQQEVDSYSAPGALERRARQLGMVPGGDPVFLNRDGSVRGTPAEATADPGQEPGPAPTRSTTARAPGRNTAPGTTTVPGSTTVPGNAAAPPATGPSGAPGRGPAGQAVPTPARDTVARTDRTPGR